MIGRLFSKRTLPQRVCSLLPRLSEGDKKDLASSYRLLGNSFLGYAQYDFAYSSIISIFSGRFDILSLVGPSLFSGLDLIIHPFVDVTGLIIFKPQVNKLRVWIPWTAATSIVSSLILHSLKVASRNAYVHGRISLSGFTKHLLPSIGARVGFSTSYGLTRYLLPDAQRIGGSFASDFAALSIGSLGGKSCEWITLGCPGTYSNVLASFVRHLPRLGTASMYNAGVLSRLLPALL
jgi:hypothetical protein